MPLASASSPELAFLNPWPNFQVHWTRVATSSLQSRRELIPAQSARLRVLAYTLSIDGNYGVDIDSWTGAVATTLGGIVFGVGRPAVLPYNPLGWFETSTDGDSLTAIVNSTVTVNSPAGSVLMRGVIVWVPIS